MLAAEAAASCCDAIQPHISAVPALRLTHAQSLGWKEKPSRCSFFFLRDSSEGRGAGSRWPDRFGAHPQFLPIQAWFELMG